VKQIMSLAISLVCLALLPKAQIKGDNESQIRELERQRFQAMQKVDVAALNRILSDDLIYTHANGFEQTKAELIRVLGSGDYKYESISASDIRVRLYGETAVVSGRATMKIRRAGEEQTFQLCYLDVYVKQDGRWQMVAWQSSRVEP